MAAFQLKTIRGAILPLNALKSKCVELKIAVPCNLISSIMRALHQTITKPYYKILFDKNMTIDEYIRLL